MLRAMKTTISLSIALGLALTLAACGDDGGGKTIDAPLGSSPPGQPAFALTTTAFKSGGDIPDANTCNGANTSPDLAWTNPPTGAKSFAVVLTDLTATLTHWTLYNIPATATSLPADVENTFQPTNVAGANQTVSIMDGTGAAGTKVVGYFGPCPPNPPVHTYQFTVYALDIAALPGLTATSKANEGLANVTIHELASASFTGNYVTPAKP
jgi:Raf kinase inhibitor-like YbhB/YbcL family protein